MEISDARSLPLAAPATPRLVALDIDGTLVGHDGEPSPAVARAVTAVRRAGHHVVLASGRSLAGVLPIARCLRLRTGWVVASNGAITARLVESGAQLVDVQPLDVQAVVRVALDALPAVRIAVEEVGLGYRVSAPFEPHEVNGAQRLVRVEQLWSEPSPRLVLRGPRAHHLVPTLRAHGVTAMTDGADWVDVTAGRISKATALEKVRADIGVDPSRTVAVGDGLNDLEMLAWAARGVAMGHAPTEVRAVADEVTATVADDGVVPVLRSLL
ncbi:HAD family hydrolase [Antribacter gilvus]|uniref:HAD family hydrolase n=1 Tax=Antribacter gilvus TaxID=2304675 RepID=UPI001F0BF37F|nr:HAD family hydrolase [Antribacter gilvus]